MSPSSSAQALVNIAKLSTPGKNTDLAGSMEIVKKIEAPVRGVKVTFHEFAAQCRLARSISDQ